MTISNLMINEQIRDKEVRLIGPDGAAWNYVRKRSNGQSSGGRA